MWVAWWTCNHEVVGSSPGCGKAARQPTTHTWQVVHTPATLSLSSIFGTGQWAVTLCGRRDNRTPDIALAVRYKRPVVSSRTNSKLPGERDEHPAYAPVRCSTAS